MTTEEKIEDIPPALEIVIELKPLCNRRWVNQKINDYGKEAFLESVGRRAKKFMLGKFVAEGHVGTFPKYVVWEGSSLAWDTNYKVVATKPKGEVRVVPKTNVICRLENK